jgi:ASC-1-like (ASCH) protein
MILRHGMRDDETGELIPAGTPVGSVGIMFKGCGSYPHMRDDEAEIGYWVCRPLWGRELVPEAVKAVMERCFTVLGLERLWCGYYENNEKSRRVQQKCGFLEETSLRIPPHPLNGATIEYFTAIPRWRWQEMREACPVHTLHLQDAPYNAILSGRKRVELRLCDYKRRMLRVGDFIQFRLEDKEEYRIVDVIGIRYFPDFETLYAELLPTLGAEALGYAEGEIPHPSDMLAYYPQDMIRYHGVLAIEIN